MSMTREEASGRIRDHMRHHGIGEYPHFKLGEALNMALTALRPVSRDQLEKVWRECPECKPRCGLCVHMGQWDKYGKPYVCEKCVGFSNFESDQKFCECCGRPLTDEAVEMVMRRLEALKDD